MVAVMKSIISWFVALFDGPAGVVARPMGALSFFVCCGSGFDRACESPVLVLRSLRLDLLFRLARGRSCLLLFREREWLFLVGIKEVLLFGQDLMRMSR